MSMSQVKTESDNIVLDNNLLEQVYLSFLVYVELPVIMRL